MYLNDLEYISIENQTTDFPKHFHETFCISLIHQGVEQINFENGRLFSEAGSISITNPYEVHSNPLMDKNSILKFDTIYISNDLMRYLLGGQNIHFIKRQINCAKTNKLFIALIHALDKKDSITIEKNLKEFIQALKRYSLSYDKEHLIDFQDFSLIDSYIENHIHNKFCLNELAGIANINKYGFVRKFKSSVGMTPMNYILMRKIFSSKNVIQSESELTEIAYQYSFTDMAHYSRTFKRFVGISPRKYQDSLR